MTIDMVVESSTLGSETWMTACEEDFLWHKVCNPDATAIFGHDYGDYCFHGLFKAEIRLKPKRLVRIRCLSL